MEWGKAGVEQARKRKSYGQLGHGTADECVFLFRSSCETKAGGLGSFTTDPPDPLDRVSGTQAPVEAECMVGLLQTVSRTHRQQTQQNAAQNAACRCTSGLALSAQGMTKQGASQAPPYRYKQLRRQCTCGTAQCQRDIESHR